MNVHTETRLRMYTGAKEGGLQDIAYVDLVGMTLVDNKDLAAAYEKVKP